MGKYLRLSDSLPALSPDASHAVGVLLTVGGSGLMSVASAYMKWGLAADAASRRASTAYSDSEDDENIPFRPRRKRHSDSGQGALGRVSMTELRSLTPRTSRTTDMEVKRRRKDLTVVAFDERAALLGRKFSLFSSSGGGSAGVDAMGSLQAPPDSVSETMRANPVDFRRGALRMSAPSTEVEMAALSGRRRRWGRMSEM